ncbi:Protocadherin-9, partial [Cichlidogyrus casuarinus]
MRTCILALIAMTFAVTFMVVRANDDEEEQALSFEILRKQIFLFTLIATHSCCNKFPLHKLLALEIPSQGVFFAHVPAVQLPLLQAPKAPLDFGALITGVPFSVDRTSGLITQLLDLDREEAASYRFRVEARDPDLKGAQNTAFTTVLVTVDDVNDNAPEFYPDNSFHFNVSEDAKHGTVVGVVTAIDKDKVQDHITFRLESPNSHFSVDPRSGEVRVTSYSLDRETTASYQITLLATDGVHVATGLIVVTVLDVNDNRPKIDYPKAGERFAVSAKNRPGDTLFRMQTSDPDLGDNGTVRFTLQSPNLLVKELLHFDTVLGVCSLAQEWTLRTSVSLVLGAHDLGREKSLNTSRVVTLEWLDHPMDETLDEFENELAKLLVPVMAGTLVILTCVFVGLLLALRQAKRASAPKHIQ